MFYYHGAQLYAVRHGRYKAHFLTKTSYVGQRDPVHHEPPLLYDLLQDPAEKHDIASKHPDVIQALTALAARHRASVEPVPSNLESRIAPN